MLESGAVVLQLADNSEALAPKDPAGRARVTTRVVAALGSSSRTCGISSVRAPSTPASPGPSAEAAMTGRLAACHARCEARPAFARAPAAQLAPFGENTPPEPA
jgi:glutathione S-transferase